MSVFSYSNSLSAYADDDLKTVIIHYNDNSGTKSAFKGALLLEDADLRVFDEEHKLVDIGASKTIAPVKGFEFQTEPGIYTFEAYRKVDGESVLGGSGAFEVEADKEKQEFYLAPLVFRLPIGYDLTDYGIEVLNYLEQPIPLGNIVDDGSYRFYVYIAMAVLADKQYSYTIIPDNERYSPVQGKAKWSSLVKGVCFTSNTSNGSLYQATLSFLHNVTFKITQGAELKLSYKYGAHFTPFKQFRVTYIENKDGYDYYRGDVPKDFVATVGGYDKDGGDTGFLKSELYVTLSSKLEPSEESSLTITIDAHKNDVLLPSSQSPSMENDVVVNVNDARHLVLSNGETFNLLPIRVWQAQGTDVMGNYFSEPDYDVGILGDNNSIDITKQGSPGLEYLQVNAKKTGVSVIRYTYRAVAIYSSVDSSREQNVTKDFTFNCSTDGFVHPAIDPVNTGVVVVTVADDKETVNDKNIETNINQHEFDTIYFDRAKTDHAVYSFAPTADSDVTVRVQDPLHAATWGAWTDYGTKPGGTEFTVDLKEGRNIIEVGAADSAYKEYYVVQVKGVTINIENKTNPDWKSGDFFNKDDEIDISFDGLQRPVPKIAGIYNPGYPNTSYVRYETEDGREVRSEGVQYTVAANNTLHVTLTEAGGVKLINGTMPIGGKGSAYGAHRNIKVGEGVRPNFSAGDTNGVFSTLPDIELYTEPEEEGDTASVTFTGKDGGAVLVVKSYAGYTKTPGESGVYTLAVGGPHKWYYYKDGYFTKTGTFGVSEDGATIALPTFSESDRIGQTPGTATVSVASDRLTLRDGLEIAYDINGAKNVGPTNLASYGHVEYNPGGYTLLNALIDSFKNGSVDIPFTARLGLLSPTVQADGGANKGAGWVCEVNGNVVAPDKLWTTLVRDGDKIVYYYNAANEGQKFVSLVPENEAPVARGGAVTLTLFGKNAGESGAGAALSGATVYVDGHDYGFRTDAQGKAQIDTSQLSYGTHVATVGITAAQVAAQAVGGDGSQIAVLAAGGNVLTYARAVFTVTKPEGATGDGVTFRLIGAKKHPGQSGYGPATEYVNWIKTVKYPLTEGTASVYTVFDWALANAGLRYVETTTNYIGRIKAPASLGGEWLAEFDNGPSSGWMYTVNGVHVGQGLRAQTVSPGDEIIWHYTDNHTLEAPMEGGKALYPSGWLTANDSDDPGPTIDKGTGGSPQPVWTPAPETKAAADTAKTVKVKFAANGGTISDKRDGKTVKVKTLTKKLTVGKRLGSLPKATRSGYYKFKGWYTAKKGGKNVTANTAVYKKDTTLYAQWRALYGKLAGKGRSVSVRAKASSSSKAKDSVSRATKLRILKKTDRKGASNDWYEVSYKNAKGKKATGYVYAGSVKTYWGDAA